MSSLLPCGESKSIYHISVFTFAFKDGTHGLKGQPWRKVDGRGRIGLMSTVLEGGHTYSLKNYVPGVREDTTSRWCATEVDDDGVMMPVGFVLA